MSRIADLLDKAAEALNDGRDPLANPFLRDNDVSYTEMLDLAQNLALGAQIAAWIHDNPRKAGTLFKAGMDAVRMETIVRVLQRWSAEGRQEVQG